MKTRDLVIQIQSLSVEEATKVLNDFIKGKTKEPLVFPFDSEAFKVVWELLLKEPKWRKKTNTAYQSALKKLSGYSEEVAIQAIEDAIAGGYQGIFPENVKLKGVIFETEAQKRLKGAQSISNGLLDGSIQWNK